MPIGCLMSDREVENGKRHVPSAPGNRPFPVLSRAVMPAGDRRMALVR
jgi:hypothetical protein